MPFVRFLPLDQSVDVVSGTSLLDAAARAGIMLRADCGGAGTCGKCKVYIRAQNASFDQTGSAETIPGDGVLACRTFVDSDLTVFVPEESRLRQTTRILTRRTRAADGEVGESRRFDCSRSPVWERFPEDRTTDRAAVRTADQTVLGAALDLGTTTLALELIDLHTGEPLGVAACENPQKSFGDDLISRIQKVLDDPENGRRMQHVLVATLNRLVADLARRTGVDSRRIKGLSVSGNSVMELLFLGEDVSTLGHSPFTPIRSHFEPVPAAMLGLTLHPEAVVYPFPLIGGFVGGDLTAGCASLFSEQKKGAVVLLDIGTNGEIVLDVADANASGGRRRYAAATAAGPALEGARIRQGMIATDGAIERITWNRTRGEIAIRTIGDAPPVGICGSGLVDAVAVLLDAGVIGPTGKIVAPPTDLPEPFASRIHSIAKPDGRPGTEFAVELISAKQTGNGTPILITQQDVRQVQLAVGAIRAGLQLLLGQAGLEPNDLSTIYLAGGFGNHTDRDSAQRIGLLPAELPANRIDLVGNSSLAGTLAGLCDRTVFDAAERIARNTEHIDLSKCPDFATRFAEAMRFPE